MPPSPVCLPPLITPSSAAPARVPRLFAAALSISDQPAASGSSTPPPQKLTLPCVLQVSVTEAWTHLRCLFSASPGSETPSPPSLQSKTLSPSLLLDLTLSGAVFGPQPAGRAAEVLHTVRHRCHFTVSSRLERR